MALPRVVSKRVAVAAVTAVLGTQGAVFLSQEGYSDLIESEALVLEVYRDSAGIPTVCIGDTDPKLIAEAQGGSLTPERCSQALVERVERDFARPVSECTRSWSSLGQETRDAIIEFSYNVGVNAYCKNSPRKYIDAYGVRGCDRMELYNKITVNGKLQESRGLTRRRAREAEKCRSGFEEV